jgi:ATP-dependent exoDNAse (exonuclease V) beta subunit
MSKQLHLFLPDPAPEPPEPQPARPAALPDAEERALALDIRRSWIVEAPAGSGKTGLLIQRFLRLLADPSVASPEQVLAITFTKKAAAEMRDRVLAQLQAAAADSPPEDEFDRIARPLAEAVLKRDHAGEGDSHPGYGPRWSLPENPRRINIRTIDSVCSEIASLLPILSGSGGRRSPVEDAEGLYALAARRTFLHLGGTDRVLHDALSLVLLHRDGNLANCERLLAQMLERREQWGALIPLDRTVDDTWLDVNVLPGLEDALDQAICSGLSKFAGSVPAPLLDRLAAAAAGMAHLDSHNGRPSPIALCSGRHSSPRALSEDLDHWLALVDLLVTAKPDWRKNCQANYLGFRLTKSDQAYLESLVAEFRQVPGLLEAIKKLRALPSATYPAEQWPVAKALFRILSRALIELQLVFAERGECDFTEISLAARIALAPADSDADSGHSLEAALGIRLQHLLVDEMQDTSSSQYELLQDLTRGWDGRSQTVFLVGDPKQSIYLFRQARVERFLGTLSSGRLGDLVLGRLRLTANFRSQAGLVAAFNTDFEQIFPAVPDFPDRAPVRTDEVTYVRAFAARTAPSLNHLHAAAGPSIAASRDGWEFPDPRVWHASVLPCAPKHPGKPSLAAINTRRQRRFDAQEIRGIVQSWRNRPLPESRSGLSMSAPWRIAVLCRSRNHLDEIVTAFKQEPAIAFRAVDVDPLKDRPEVQDLFALTRALLHPADRVAWLALLRAPWCGLTLADLHILTGQDDPLWAERTVPSLIAERARLLRDDSRRRLERISPVLEAAVRARARLPLAQLIERTWRSLGGDTWLDPVQLSNAVHYLQLLDDVEAGLEGQSGIQSGGGVESGGRTFDLPLLTRRLDKLYAAPIIHPEAVDLLTIHKAKGLEWDVVIVPGLERTPAPTRSPLLNWVEFESSDEDSAHILLAPIAGKGEDSDALYKWINSIRSSRERAEIKRLFYVACTRAREELHLFAAPTLTSKGGIEPKPTSLLAAAWPAAGTIFAAIPAPTDQNAQEDDQQAEAASAIITSLAAEAPTGSTEPEADDAWSEDAAASADLEDLTISSSTVLADDWDTDGDSTGPLLAFPPPEHRSTLKRLPLTFHPAARLRNPARLVYEDEDSGRGGDDSHAGPLPVSLLPRFDRPQGSLAARALGNAVHAFLEAITAHIAAGEPPALLLSVLPSWAPRVAAILRSEGLPPADVELLNRRVLLALENTLKDPIGLWLISPHVSAATEYAITAQLSPQLSERSNIRIDRVFRAGPEPRTSGTTHLWVIDYKTATHGTGGLDDFLDEQRVQYAPQLEAYAAVLARDAISGTLPPSIRLALYFPMLARLIWWQPSAPA